MRSYSALALGAAAALLAALPLTAQTAPPAASGQVHMHQKMPRPTNLQVLSKDISGPDLIATMRGYAKALGVQCEFCHAEDPKTGRLNFASDAKPDKTIARTMMRMTTEINTEYLSTVHDPDASEAQKTVTCGTCHRGETMPAPFVPASAPAKPMGAPGKPE